MSKPLSGFPQEGRGRKSKKSIMKHTNRNISILHPDSEFRSRNILYFHYFPFKKEITNFVAVTVVYCLVSARKLFYELLLSPKNNITLYYFNCHSSFR